MSKPNNLLDSLIMFEELVEKKPDTADSVPDFLAFLRHFFRNKHPKYSLPTIEIISIIKHKKPTVFYFLRRQSSRDPMLQLVIDVEIDLEKALERIQFLKSKL